MEHKEILTFETPHEWRTWLEHNYQKEDGIWVRFAKKNSSEKTINYDQALDEALCFGWIDGLVNKYDETSYIQKFTPRRAKSVWSKRNTEHIARLEKEGRMHESGRSVVRAAQADGRWDRAYESPANMPIPEDLLRELAARPSAKQFFDTLTKANVYAITWRLHTAAKPETRAKRLSEILKMLEGGKKFH